jgi:hypothetical protein
MSLQSRMQVRVISSLKHMQREHFLTTLKKAKKKQAFMLPYVSPLDDTSLYDASRS